METWEWVAICGAEMDKGAASRSDSDKLHQKPVSYHLIQRYCFGLRHCAEGTS